MESFENKSKNNKEGVSSEKLYQNKILQNPTDEEVEKISSSLKILHKANTDYQKINRLIHEIDYAGLIEKSGSSRMIELGSTDRVLRDVEKQKSLQRAGIKEYIAVDYDLSTHYLENQLQTNKNDTIICKGLCTEILKALHSFPDDYGNVWMTGLDQVTFGLNIEWQFAVVAELKRVVPENGFIFTDGGFIDSVLEKSSSDFRNAKDALQISSWNNKVEQENKNKLLQNYECEANDPFGGGKEVIHPKYGYESIYLGKYVINASEIGFRIYFNKIDLCYPIIIINTDKYPHNK